MNALYDAPVDGEGKPLFAEVPVRERVLMRADEKALVQYGCDGERFAVSVRDSLRLAAQGDGARTTSTSACTPSAPSRSIARRAAPASGSTSSANSASDVSFHIFAGSATEVVCTFDLAAPRAQLRSLGVFEERIEGARAATSPVTTIPSRRGRRHEDLAPPPPPPRSGALLPVMMTFAVLLLVVRGRRWPRCPICAGRPRRRCASRPIRRARSSTSTAARAAARRSASTPRRAARYAVRAVRPGCREDRAAGHRRRRRRAGAAAPARPRRHARRRDRAGRRARLRRRQGDRQADARRRSSCRRRRRVLLTLRKDGFVRVGASRRRRRRRASARSTTTALSLAGSAALLTVATDAAGRQRQRRRPRAGAAGAVARHLRRAGVRHKVKASAPGFVDARAEVTVAGGEHKSLQLTLVEGGTLALRTNVAAKVLLDDKPIGTAPILPLGVAAGEHTLALRGRRRTSIIRRRFPSRRDIHSRCVSTSTPTTRSPATSASGRSPINGRLR